LFLIGSREKGAAVGVLFLFNFTCKQRAVPPKYELNIETVCMDRKFLTIEDAMGASCARITHTHQEILMTKLRINITNRLEELRCRFYFFDDEGG
jgi:hypothetical protein